MLSAMKALGIPKFSNNFDSPSPVSGAGMSLGANLQKSILRKSLAQYHSHNPDSRWSPRFQCRDRPNTADFYSILTALRPLEKV